MKKMVNKVHLEGLLYDAELEKKYSSNTQSDYIRGSIKVATDEECLNVIEVKFNYVSPFTKAGQPRRNYIILNNIIEGKTKTLMNSSPDEAAYLQVDGEVGLNDFPTKDRTTGENVMVSVKMVDNAFLKLIFKENLDPILRNRNSFEVDYLITKCTTKEGNPERNTPDKMNLHGAAFSSYKGNILPMDLSVINPDVMDFFNQQDISNENPCFIKVRGKIVSETVTRLVEEESAFGEPAIRKVESKNKDYVIESGSSPSIFDDESTITAQEVNEKLQERELYLADVKRRRDEYMNSQKNFSAPAQSEQKFKF